MTTPQKVPSDEPPLPGEEPPPFFGSWNRLYSAVLGYLLFLIVALYFLAQLFRY